MKRTKHTAGLSFYEEEKSVNMDLVRRITAWILITIVAILLAVFVVIFMAFRLRATDTSMEPEIASGQNVFVDRLTYRLSQAGQGDVIAFYPGGDEETVPSLKRVVATPGHSVQIVDQHLLVDGVPVSSREIYATIENAGIAEHTVVLGENEYFVIGDNITQSEDSRSAGIGLVRDTYIIGKVWYKLPGSGGSMGVIH